MATAAVAGAYLLLPGLTATLALMEINRQHLQAGGARLQNALQTWSQLAIGAILAGLVWGQPAPTAPAPSTDVWCRPAWWACQAVAGAATGLSTHARPDTLARVALGSLVGAGAWSLGAFLVSDLVGCLLAGAAIVVVARACTWLTDTSDWDMLYPPLQLLVPGSSGLRGLIALLDGDFASASVAIRGATLRAVCLSLGVATGQATAHVGGELTQALARLRRRVAASGS